MANLFDIGRSGLNSYRQGLAITGQNIANINTDGYKRRGAELEELSAAKASVLEARRLKVKLVAHRTLHRNDDRFRRIGPSFRRQGRDGNHTGRPNAPSEKNIPWAAAIGWVGAGCGAMERSVVVRVWCGGCGMVSFGAV